MMPTIGKAYSTTVDSKSLPTGVLSFAIDNGSATNFSNIGGLQINATTGAITGTPTNSGSFNVQVNAIGANSTVLARTTVMIMVSTPTFNYISTGLVLGATFNYLPIDSTLPKGVASYAVSSNSTTVFNSIGGITLNTTTGAISGAPQKVGNFSIIINAIDANSKTIASASVFINVSLPTFYYATTGETFVGTQSTIKTDKVPTNVKSFVLDANSQTIFNGIGGLTLDATTGYISGKPGKIGSFNLNVYGVDENNNNVASAILMLNITFPRFNYTYAGQIIQGATFTLSPIASSITAGITTYSLDTASTRSLNSIGGVTFNSTTGVITGKPEKTGYFNFQILGLDATGNTVATSWAYLNITLPNFYYSFNGQVLVGAQYNSKAERYPSNVVSFAIDSSGTKALVNAGGLTFNAADGLVTGKPTNIGYYSFQVYGLDVNKKVVAIAFLSINVTLPTIEYITSNNMPISMATVGSNYSIKVATMPAGVVKYTIDSATANNFTNINGLQLDATTGSITGIPVNIGSYNYKVNAYDANSKIVATAQNFLYVQFPSFDYLMTGQVIIDSNFSINVKTPPSKVKTYAIDSTTLTNFNNVGGLTLNTATGQISGTARKLGNYYLKVNAYDDFSKLLAVANLSINVTLPMFTYENKGIVIVNKPVTINPINKPTNAKTFAIDTYSQNSFEKVGGLSLNTTTGVITGTPLNPGGVGFLVNAYDANSNKIATGNASLYLSLPRFSYNINDTIYNKHTTSVDSLLSVKVKTKPTGTIRFALDTMMTKTTFDKVGGLEFDELTGTISGKPQSKIGFPIFVNAYDENSLAIGSSNFALNITYPVFKYTPGSERGVIDSAYNAKVVSPVEGAVSYTLDTNSYKFLTDIGGVSFNKTNGSITGVPKNSGYMYLLVNAFNAAGKQVGVSTLIAYIRKTSTIKINSSILKYTYNGLAQGPASILKTGSSGQVTLKYTSVSNNNFVYDLLPKLAGDYQAEAFLAEDSFYYSAMSAPFKFTIDKAPITIVAKPQLKAYGTAITTIANSAYEIVGNLVNNEIISSVKLSPDAPAMDAKTAAGSIYKIIPSEATGSVGFTSSNYNITYKPYEGIVSKIPLTVTATGPTKLVGSLLTSQVATTNFTATGMLAGETVTSVTLTPDAKGLSDTTSAGAAYKVIPSLAKGEGGFLENNYAVTYVPYEGVVTKRNLVITATGPSKTFGTALTAATNASNFIFSGLGSGEKITEVLLTPDAKGLSSITAVGDQYTITPSAAKGSFGNLADNYNITYVPFTGTVSKKSLTIFATGPNKNYGTALTAGISTTNFKTTELAGTDLITEVTLTPNAAGLSSTTAAGANYLITPSEAKGSSTFVASNYEITYVPFIGAVAKVAAPINVTGNKTYAYTGKPQGPSTTNLTAGNITYTYSGVSPTLYAPSSVLPTEAGTYQVIAKVAASDNFFEATSAPFTFSIDKGSSVVTVTGETAYVYNGKNQGPSTATLVGSAENIVFTYSGVAPTVYAASTTAPRNVGTYKVVATVASDANFSGGTSAEYNFSIIKAKLKVTADNKSKTFGLALPKLTLFYTGFGVGDDSTSLTTVPVASTTATAASAVGTYPITVTGAVSNNYTFEYIAGTLTIDLKIDPTISLTDAKTSSTPSAEGAIRSSSMNSFVLVQRNTFTSSKTFGDLPFTLSASSNSTGTFSFRSHNPNVVTISGNIVTIVGAGTALIEVIQDAGGSKQGSSEEFHEGNASATLSVNRASTSITPVGDLKYTFNNLANGPDSATVRGSSSLVTFRYSGKGSTTYASTETKPTQVGTYQVIASVLADYNYNGAVSSSLEFAIEKSASSIVIKDVSNYTYNGTAQGPTTSIVSGSGGAVTYTYVGTGTTTYAASSTLPSNAGTYAAYAAVAADASYNTATSEAFAFTIEKANSTVFATGDKTYTYKGSAQGPANTTGLTGSTGAVTYYYTGSGTTTYARSTTAPSNSGTYTVVAEVAADNNYNGASSPAFDFTIIKATVNINMTGATTYSYTGSAQGPNTTNISSSATDITYTYTGIGTTNYASSTTKPTNVGTYKVVATTSEDANQFGATSDAYEFAIVKANSTIVVTGDKSFVYNATAQAPATSTKTGSTGLITYVYSGTGTTNYEASNFAPTLVGTYQVVATLVSDENYNGVVSTAYDFAIEKANSTIAATGETAYVYNASSQGPATATSEGSTGAITYRYSGTGTTTYTATATAPTLVGTYRVIASIAGDANYNGASSIAYAFAITKATPTVTVTPVETTIYTGKVQGPTTSIAEGTTAIPTILYTGTLFNSTVYGPSTTRPKNAGSYIAIASVVADANYTSANSPNFEFTIGQAPLTVIADNKEKTYNYPNPTFTYRYDPSNYFVNGEDESALTTKPHVTSEATTTSDVSTYSIYFDVTGTANNYEISTVDGSFEVSARYTPEITFNNVSKTYGAAKFILAATSNSGGAIFYESDNTDVATIVGNEVTIVGAGIANITLTQDADVPNNFMQSSARATLTVAKAPLTATAVSAARIYGAANPSLEVTYTGFVNGENKTVFTTEPVASHIATTVSTVGDYAITISEGVANNYTITNVNGTLTINKAPLTITAIEVAKVYGTSLANATASTNFTATSTALVGETVTTVNIVADANAQSATTNAAATYTMIPSAAIGSGGFNADNYDITYIPYTGIVAKKSMTITASGPNKTYGTAIAAGTSTNNYTATGTIIGETVTEVTLTPNDNALAATTNAGANYIMTPSAATGTGGFNADNYDITYVPFTGTVAKKALTATIENKSKTYGSDNPVLSIIYDGFVNGEDVTAFTTAPVVTSTATKASSAGVYDVTITEGVTTNYTVTYTNGKLTINKAILTVTAEDKSKTYGSANPNLTVKYAGFVNGDTEASLTTAPKVNTTATSTSNAGVYDITLSDVVSDNYTVALTNGKLTINKANLTVTAEDKSKTYGSANPSLTVKYAGFVNGDTEASLTTAPKVNTTATSSSNAGVYDITLSDAVSDNYTVALTNAKLTINKAMLTVTAEDKSKTYGSVNPNLTFKYTGFVNSQDATILTKVPTVSTVATAVSKVGKYDIVLAGGSDINYDFTYANGALTIDKATLIITAQNAARCFAATDPTLSYKITGFVNNETESVLTNKLSITTNAIASSKAGAYAVTVFGGDATNYLLTYVGGVFTVNPLPTGTVSSLVDYICDGSTLQLKSIGGITYTWYKDGVTVPGISAGTLDVVAAGTYTTKVVNEFGCEAMATNNIKILKYVAPVANFDYQYYCVDKPVNIINSTNYVNSGTVKFAWDNGAGGTSALTNPVFTYNSIGSKSIKLTVTPDNCPQLKSELTKVVPIEAPTASIRMTPKDVIINESVALAARTFGTNYEWTPGFSLSNSFISNPTVKTDKEVTFNIKITVPSSCVTNDTLQVRVFNERNVYLPNTFTPNNDGVNDIFRINPVGISELKYFRIFNQWGVKVFETNNVTEGWDGRLGGVNQPLATYTWLIEAVDTNGKVIRQSGSITLLR
jgi:gliding motility-associated-like protein